MTYREEAEKIASKANECCYRSDGYEEKLTEIITKALEATYKLAYYDKQVVEIVDNKVYNEGLKKAVEIVNKYKQPPYDGKRKLITVSESIVEIVQLLQAEIENG